MIYEMRVYRCVPGRLPELLKRFEEARNIRLSEDGGRHSELLARWKLLANPPALPALQRRTMEGRPAGPTRRLAL